MLRHATLACVAAALAACASGFSRLTVTPAGSALALAPRPADCKVEFYRTKSPDRGYDEVASLHFRGTVFASAENVQELMRSRACELGADAVVVTLDFISATPHTPSLMTGTAVSYRDLRQQHRLDAVLRREAERAAAEQAAKEAAAQAAAARAPGAAKAPAAAAATARAGAPAGFVPARVKQAITARALPDRQSKELADLASGARVWVAAKPSGGWRRIWVPDEPTAWVEDDVLDLRGPAPAPQAPAPAPAEPGSTVGSPSDV
jgi:hypothetical protein